MPNLGNIKYWPTIWVRDGGRCVYCGLDGRQDFKIFRAAFTTDHVVPKRYAKKSPDPTTFEQQWNHVLCCHFCNYAKGRDYDPSGQQMPALDEGTMRAYIEKVRKHLEGLMRDTGRYKYCWDLFPAHHTPASSQ